MKTLKEAKKGRMIVGLLVPSIITYALIKWDRDVSYTLPTESIIEKIVEFDSPFPFPV